MPLEGKKCVTLVVCFLIAFSLGALGGLFTRNSVNDVWYLMSKSPLTPTNSTFGIVWTVLYALIACSLYLVWTQASPHGKNMIINSYGINIVANGLWAPLFFGLREPMLAFIDLFIVFLSIFAMMRTAYKIDTRAFLLLIPYLIWICFGLFLNASFIILQRAA